MATTILIVDDSKLARLVAGKTIRALQPDWERLEAASADAALATLAERPVDIALLDFNMPGRDGLELAAEVRARYPAMPLALITANLQDEVIARARAVQVAFVAKPITEDGLRGFLAGAALRLRTGGR